MKKGVCIDSCVVYNDSINKSLMKCLYTWQPCNNLMASLYVIKELVYFLISTEKTFQYISLSI